MLVAVPRTYTLLRVRVAMQLDALTKGSPATSSGDDVLQHPVIDAVGRSRPVLGQALFHRTSMSALQSTTLTTRRGNLAPTPSLEKLKELLQIILSDPAKEGRVMGRGDKLHTSRVAGEAIDEADIDGTSIVAHYNCATDGQAMKYLLGCTSAFTPAGRVSIRNWIDLYKITGNITE